VKEGEETKEEEEVAAVQEGSLQKGGSF